MTYRVLICDEMNPGDLDISGFDIEYVANMPREEVIRRVGEFDALITRSRTKVDAELLDAGLPRLKVIGRGGVGVDNIDLDAASRRGVLVFSSVYALIALWGAGITVWHLLVQYGPKESAITCASSLPFPIDLNALPGWIAAVIRPVGDCSVADFTLFGMSMPFWLLVAFIGFLLPLSMLARTRLVEIRRRGL